MYLVDLYQDFDAYSKCPKSWYIKVSDVMEYANSADPDQTALQFAIPLSILGHNYIKTKLHQKMYGNKMFKILGHLLYCGKLCHHRVFPDLHISSFSPTILFWTCIS